MSFYGFLAYQLWFRSRGRNIMDSILDTPRFSTAPAELNSETLKMVASARCRSPRGPLRKRLTVSVSSPAAAMIAGGTLVTQGKEMIELRPRYDDNAFSSGYGTQWHCNRCHQDVPN